MPLAHWPSWTDDSVVNVAGGNFAAPLCLHGND